MNVGSTLGCGAWRLGRRSDSRCHVGRAPADQVTVRDGVTVVCYCAASDAVSRSCEGPLTLFGLSSCLLFAGSVFCARMWAARTAGKSKQRTWVTQATGLLGRKSRNVHLRKVQEIPVSQRLHLQQAQKQNPPECLTTVLLRERIARLAGQATPHQWSRICVLGRGTWRWGLRRIPARSPLLRPVSMRSCTRLAQSSARMA